MSTKVLSVGGSIIAPDKPDEIFIAEFVSSVSGYLNNHPNDRLIMVIGGGGPARAWQQVLRSVVKQETVHPDDEWLQNAADMVGVQATRLNAELIKSTFGPDFCKDPIVTDPTLIHSFQGQVLIVGGWKPGFSTDNVAVILAVNHNAKTVVNLSNIDRVCDKDPKTNPDATPLDEISWADFRQMVGDKWAPGANLPFDPIASRNAAEHGLTVICANGRNLENLDHILNDEPFIGTTIH